MAEWIILIMFAIMCFITVKDLEELYELLLKDKQKTCKESNKSTNAAVAAGPNNASSNNHHIVLPTEYILLQVYHQAKICLFAILTGYLHFNKQLKFMSLTN